MVKSCAKSNALKLRARVRKKILEDILGTSKIPNSTEHATNIILSRESRQK